GWASFWSGVKVRRRGPSARGCGEFMDLSSLTVDDGVDNGEMLMVVVPVLALRKRTCYEPVVSTHPDTQGYRRTVEPGRRNARDSPCRRTIMNALATSLQIYFTTFARTQRDLSPHTVDSYRDTWKLLFKHLSRTLAVPVREIDFDSLTPTNITGFLDYLEHERGNSAKTRN